MRGIMFIEPLFHRSVAGLKTMTRRESGLEIVNGDKKKGIDSNPDNWGIVGMVRHIPKGFKSGIDPRDLPMYAAMFVNKITGEKIVCKALYPEGTTVYFKEPTALIPVPGTDKKTVCYKFGCNGNEDLLSRVAKWDNKMFMGAGRARYFAKITGLKCERVIQISSEDSIKEGVEFMELKNKRLYKDYLSKDGWNTFNNPIQSFFSLFKFANKKKIIENKWVFAYTYEMVNKPQ